MLLMANLRGGGTRGQSFEIGLSPSSARVLELYQILNQGGEKSDKTQPSNTFGNGIIAREEAEMGSVLHIMQIDWGTSSSVRAKRTVAPPSYSCREFEGDSPICQGSTRL